MRALWAIVMCAAPVWARLCGSDAFWSSERQRCAPCLRCGAGEVQLFSCRPYQDAVCGESPRPPPPPTDVQAHRARLAEERLRLQLERAGEALQVERTGLETAVFEWQTTVFVVSILVTFALVFSFLAMLLRRTGTIVSKGVEDCSRLILNREDGHWDENDQGSLAFADFNAIKIGRRPFDSPYSDLSAPRPPASASALAANRRPSGHEA